MTIKENRVARLREWFAERPIPAKEKSYLSQLMGGSASFGEKAARRLEETYAMPPGFLDIPVDYKGSILARMGEGDSVRVTRLSTGDERVLQSSWGKPDKVNRTTSPRGTREQWVYRGSHNYLYFEDGILVTIQN